MGGHNIFGRKINSQLSEKQRVFISHRMSDKRFARAIASYFESIGLHYYFDEEDSDLQMALKKGGNQDLALVNAIDKGIEHSTLLLAVLSKRTMGSWWVPYEIGSARARNKDVYHLLLPSISMEMVPEYLRIYPQLWTSKDLFEVISKLTPWKDYLVNIEYSEYLSDIFGELDPDEETVAHWYSTAELKNRQWLHELDNLFKEDMHL